MSEIFIPPKIKIVGFRVGGDRIHSDLIGLRRTQSESAAELFLQLYYPFLTIWSWSECHGQWSKILTMTMAKISAFNHGQMIKISTMTTAKIQIFHGQNGQSKILPQNLTKKHHDLDHGHERNTNFLWSKW